MISTAQPYGEVHIKIAVTAHKTLENPDLTHLFFFSIIHSFKIKILRSPITLQRYCPGNIFVAINIVALLKSPGPTDNSDGINTIEFLARIELADHLQFHFAVRHSLY